MPNTREKLIELLISVPDLWATNGTIQGIADHLIANGVTVQEWISVNDRLPEEDEDVLVANEYNIVGVWTFLGDSWEDEEGWLEDLDEVTHWMPLPQPPKGD